MCFSLDCKAFALCVMGSNFSLVNLICRRLAMFRDIWVEVDEVAVDKVEVGADQAAVGTMDGVMVI